MVPSLTGITFIFIVILLSPLWIADKLRELFDDEERFS